NVMPSSGLTELFSQQMPAYPGPPIEEGLAPIDVLYGHYIPEHMRIEIFVNRIRADAPRFKSQFLDLLAVVRIHEYAHAIVHAGVNTVDVAKQLAKLGVEGTTDWESFRTDRDRAFSALDDESSELLAQAITWGCISQEPASPQSQPLIQTFLALEERQPPRYQLPPKVKQRARLANWSVVLRVAQGELDIYREPSFKLAAGLADLITKTAEPRDVTETLRNNTLARIASELQERLATVDLVSPGPVPDDGTVKLLVLRKECIELRMYKEAAHHRPHFHIEYKSEFEASYALDNFERLAGYMPRKYEDVILPVARASQGHLIDFWRSLNGTARIVVSANNA
ncbi:MAG TPA: DUF4160 domain-containing protein, partial [Candidatus Cybelea sp.]|nr:DUF4160 domain-containing protein [Candidatus Cybelea sp.]